MYGIIKNQSPRFDTTFLWKAKAFERVKREGQIYLYRLAWYLHFKEVIKRVSVPGDTVYVIAGCLSTNRRLASAREALQEVCDQVCQDRQVVLCFWDAPTTWGIQVADYDLWAFHRSLEGRLVAAYRDSVWPTLFTVFTPWGKKEHVNAGYPRIP